MTLKRLFMLNGAIAGAYGIGVILALWGTLVGPFNALGWIAVGLNLLLGPGSHGPSSSSPGPRRPAEPEPPTGTSIGGFTATPADVGPALRDRPSRSGGVRSRGATPERDQALDGWTTLLRRRYDRVPRRLLGCSLWGAGRRPPGPGVGIRMYVASRQIERSGDQSPTSRSHWSRWVRAV